LVVPFVWTWLNSRLYSWWDHWLQQIFRKRSTVTILKRKKVERAIGRFFCAEKWNTQGLGIFILKLSCIKLGDQLGNRVDSQFGSDSKKSDEVGETKSTGIYHHDHRYTRSARMQFQGSVRIIQVYWTTRRENYKITTTRHFQFDGDDSACHDVVRETSYIIP